MIISLKFIERVEKVETIYTITISLKALIGHFADCQSFLIEVLRVSKRSLSENASAISLHAITRRSGEFSRYKNPSFAEKFEGYKETKKRRENYRK